MTTPVIDLMKSQSDSLLLTSIATTSTITTTTTLPPPPHIRSYKAIDEIVTDPVNWAKQAPFRARFRDLPTVDMKEILQQRIFEYNTYKTHEEEARKKKRKKRAAPRTPSGSPPSPPPPLPPPASSSRALGTLGASRSSQLPPPPPLPSTGASVSDQLQADILGAQELSPIDYLMQDDSIPEEQVHLSDDEDFENDHQPKANSRKDWWKTLPEKEIPLTPEPAWTIPSSNKSNVVNNWASALAATYEPPAKNSLLAKIGDMTTFMNWYCQKVNKTMLTQADFEGLAYEVVKAFYPDVIHL
ncbi:hypothetical protein Tco_0852764 [Tanacetum coccineum]